jgi:hypothetical protein
LPGNDWLRKAGSERLFKGNTWIEVDQKENAETIIGFKGEERAEGRKVITERKMCHCMSSPYALEVIK